MTQIAADRFPAGWRGAGPGRLALAVQPVFAASDRRTLLFSEALLRLERPGGETLAAGRFLPRAQADGHGVALDRAALGLALSCLRADPSLVLSVNVSPATIDDTAWSAALADWLKDHTESANRLVVEITETFAPASESAIGAFTRALRAHGIRVALDDFGAGDTAVQHLTVFGLDILKIDGRHIRGISANPGNQILVRALVDISRSLSLLTVAEQVEDARDADWLTEAGIDGLQGYLLGRPTLVAPAQISAD